MHVYFFVFQRVDTQETATAELDHQIEASTHSGGTSTIIEEEEEESSAKDSKSKPTEEKDSKSKPTEEKVNSASPSDNAAFKAPAPVSSVVTYHIGRVVMRCL